MQGLQKRTFGLVLGHEMTWFGMQVVKTGRVHIKSTFASCLEELGDVADNTGQHPLLMPMIILTEQPPTPPSEGACVFQVSTHQASCVSSACQDPEDIWAWGPVLGLLGP